MSQKQDVLSAPEWFDIEKYSSMVSFNFRDWATQIGNRFFLNMLLTNGMHNEFDQFIARIQENPFDDLGYKASYPSDKTVFPLTFGVAKSMTDLLYGAGCGDKEFCDDKLREIEPEMYAAQSMLFINLKAPRSLLKKQFDEWLDKSLLERKRGPAITQSVTQTWAINHPILPYQDLKLWNLRQGIKMPSDFVMAEWLSLVYGDRHTVRELREKTEWIFTMDCYFDLLFSASNATSSSA